MRPALLCLLVLLVAACDSSEPDSPLGEFEASITGDVSRSLAGDAVFQTTTFPDGSRALQITMVPGDGLPPGPTFSMTSLGISDFDGVLTGTGSYSLRADAPRALGLTFLDFGDDPTTLTSQTGTLVITRFERDRIDGTFEAELAETFGGDAESRIEGSFSARPLPSR